MEKQQIQSILKNKTLFSSLDETSLNQVVDNTTVVELNANEILFYQGDPAEHIYFLIDGKLAALIVTGMNETRILGYVHPFEAVGEMGVLTDEPRTLTIKALIKSTLFKLPKREFMQILHQYPSVMFAIIKPLVSRSTGLMQMLSMEKQNKSIVILPANQNTSLREFSAILQKTAEKFPSTLFISDDQTEFSDKSDTPDTLREKIKN